PSSSPSLPPPHLFPHFSLIFNYFFLPFAASFCCCLADAPLLIESPRMESNDHQIHVMFLPFLAPGHMMPMVDMARLFAANNAKVTIVTTTMNALRFKNTIDRDIESGRQITVESVRFPAAEVGLPEGGENLNSIPTPEMTFKLFHAIDLLQPYIEQLFRERKPDCIASDYLFPWTAEVASELNIPRIAFSGSGFFNLCVSDSIERYQPHRNILTDTETFIVPNLPDQVALTRSQLPDIVKTKTDFSAFFEKVKEAERKSFGVLMNSFYELEPAYIDHFREVIGMKAWHLGPVSLFNRDADDKADRGDTASVSGHNCLNWLDNKKPNSVLYICFGSLTRFSRIQVTEIANALEDSGHSFIWVVGKVLPNKDDDNDLQKEEWLPEGFECKARESSKGLIIRGWAPQILILEHPAIGGFLTHCGWNSILEGVSAGVPMVTWPIFAEQFYNEKLVTQVLKFGVPVGNEVWKLWAMQETPLINRDKIMKAVNAVMSDRGEALVMRKNATRLGELARNAVERGGSSFNDMKTLIEEITAFKYK
ncbi:UDPGT domain-containing protein, partial [Cephalotus follicularis]